MAFQCSDKAWHLQVDYCFQLVVRHRHRCRPRIETGRETGKEGERERGREGERESARDGETVDETVNCSWCDGKYNPSECRFKEAKGHACGKIGNISSACRSKEYGEAKFGDTTFTSKKIIHYIPIT